jgi:methenyltetrahydromethanopterin cyclohydrolase
MANPSTAMRLNDRGLAIADAVAGALDEHRAKMYTLESGSRVIDLGIDAPGGLGAGLALAGICMGGLGHINFQQLTIGGESYQGVEVWTDIPDVACMASQYAGWAIKVDKFFAMGSGPIRSLCRVETELFRKLGYEETSTKGIIVLETRAHPTDAVATWIASRSRVAPGDLTIVVAPTASAAGGVQIVARVLETGMHKLDAIGFDITRVMSAIGSAPVPPTAKDDLRAIGRTNDCILYGGEARFVVDAPDDTLQMLAAKLPASASSDYGTPFIETFRRYNGDFYKIDPQLFSPAEVWLTSATTGETFHGGHLNPEVLRNSLYGQPGVTQS